MLLPVLKIASAICVHLCKISKCYCHVPHKILAVRGWGSLAGGGGERGSRRVVGKDSPVVTWFHIVPWPFALFCIVWGCCCGTQSMARFFLFVFVCFWLAFPWTSLLLLVHAFGSGAVVGCWPDGRGGWGRLLAGSLVVSPFLSSRCA